MNDVMVSGDPSAAAEFEGPEHPHLAESFDAESVLALLAYEETHGQRPAVVEALKERLAAVRSGVEPSGPLGEHLPRPTPLVD